MKKNVAGEGAMQRLFAVTADKSIYSVTAPIGSKHPIVEVLGGKNGGSVPLRLINHQSNLMIAILKSGIQMYYGNVICGIPQRIDEVSPCLWEDYKSSAVVALFAKKEKAMECFSVIQTLPKVFPCDSLWKDETLSIIERIKTGHPTFTLSDVPGYAFC